MILDFTHEQAVMNFLDSGATSVNKPLNLRPSSLITSKMRDMLLQSKDQRAERRGNGSDVLVCRSVCTRQPHFQLVGAIIVFQGASVARLGTIMKVRVHMEPLEGTGAPLLLPTRGLPFP